MSRALRLFALLLTLIGCVVARDTESLGSPIGSPVHSPIGSPIPGGAAPAWTPAKSSPLLWIDPGKASTFPGGAAPANGGAISSIADATGKVTTLTQASGARQPTYDSTDAVNGWPAISMSTNLALASASGGVTGTVPHSLVVVAYTATAPATYLGLITLGGEGTTSSTIGHYTGPEIWAGGAFVVVPAFSPFPPNGLHVFEKVSDGSNISVWIDGDQLHEVITPTTGSVAQALPIANAGLGIYGYTTNTAVTGRIYQALWYDRALTDAERRKLERYFGSHFAIAKSRVRAIGDSLTLGYLSSDPATRSYPAVMAGLLTTPTDIVNIGVSGKTVNQMLSDVVAKTNTYCVDQLYSGLRPKEILILWGGTNDFAAGTGAAQVESDYQTFASGRRAVGFRVVAVTSIKRGNLSGPQDAVRVAFNTWLRANWSSFADALVDLDADAVFASSSNLTYYNADTVHLTDAGYARVGVLMAPQVQGLLQIGPGSMPAGAAALALLAGLVVASRRRAAAADKAA